MRAGFSSVFRSVVVATALAIPSAALSAVSEGGIGDLLVAPTRLVLDGRRGAEVILSNIGTEPATYRISVELRRMTEDGALQDVATPSERDRIAEDMIVYAPRRVTLAPRTPQSIRIAARPGASVADGEYRVHLLFRAIPPATPAAAPDAQKKGLSFALIPVYGVTIPVIVRLGNLEVKAGISDVRLETKNGKRNVLLDLERSGDRSTYGEIRVLKAGVKDPIAVQRGVAVYTEVNRRHVSIPLNEAFAGDPRGPVSVQYVETFDDGTHTLAEAQAVLR
jgi:hypothetical protein